MKIEATFGIGQELEIRNFMEVKKYGIKEPFVTIRSIEHSSIEIFVKRSEKAEGFEDLEKRDMYYACNGKFDKHYYGGIFLWERHLYSATEKDERLGGHKTIRFNLEIALIPVSEDVVASLKADIEYMKKNGVTGFFANYTICNGGGSFKDMSIEDAVFAPSMKDGKYVGFKVINLSNHRTVTSEDLREACKNKPKKGYKYTTYDEHPKSNDYNSDRDHFYGGLYINEKVKTNESGYDATL